MTLRLPVVLAVVLTAAGELEVLLGSADASERLVSALALPAITLPLAWSRRAPLAALWVMAAALLIQAALGGFLIGYVVTTVVALGLALYSAGRHAATPRSVAGAAAAAVAVAATRVGFDPAAQHPREAILTFVAVASPLLVGRWVRSQSLLQGELADKAARRARDRARDARHAADEERARIAADLQVAVAGGLRAIVGDAEAVERELRAGESAAARERLERIARTARAALADVRRVLGVLRHDGEAPRLAPPQGAPLAALPADTPAPVPPPVEPQAAPGRTLGGERLLVAVVLAVAAIELAIVSSPAAPLTAVPIVAPLLWRRSRPVVVAPAVLAAMSIQSALLGLDSFPVGNILAMICATYALGAYADRRLALAGLAVTAAGAAVHAAVFYPEGVVPALLGGVALPWAVGRVVSGNRQLTLEGRKRSVEVERSRVREARAAVTGERMRVARELHDAVAHNISVIAIQAGGADGIVERDPERAAQSVALIASVAREAIAELGRLAGLPAAGTAPSLAHVERLLDRARAAGLSVNLQVDGTPPPLPAGVDLTAFRIVQEALANTAKHAHAHRAWVAVHYAPRAVELEIGDDGRGANGGGRRDDGGGHGLIGMRERVGLYGGSLDVGRGAGGGFLVKARLPIEGS